MKTFLVLLVCVFIGVWFFSAAPAQDPVAPSAVSDQVVSLTYKAGADETFIITGRLIQEEDENPLTGTDLVPVIVDVKRTGSGFGYSSDGPMDESAEQKRREVIAALMREPFAMSKIETEEIPPDKPNVASFTLYLSAHNQGVIKDSPKTGAYYDKQSEGFAGMAIVVCNETYRPPEAKDNYLYLDKFRQLAGALLPLADRFKCGAIWVEVKVSETRETMQGVIWGGEHPRCHILSHSFKPRH